MRDPPFIPRTRHVNASSQRAKGTDQVTYLAWSRRRFGSRSSITLSETRPFKRVLDRSGTNEVANVVS